MNNVSPSPRRGTHLRFFDLFRRQRRVRVFLRRHASDELAERRGPFGRTVERGRPIADRRRFVRVGRCGRRRRDAGIGRELTATAAAASHRAAAPHRAASRGQVFLVVVVAGRRERVVDVRHETRQRTAGHGPFGRGRRRVRERARGQPFREFGALQFDVRRGHPVGGTAELVQRETASHQLRSLFPGTRGGKKQQQKLKKKIINLQPGRQKGRGVVRALHGPGLIKNIWARYNGV